MYEKGDKFYYYGDDESLHGREGIVIRKMEGHGTTKEYHCKVNGFRHSKYLPKWKMRKIPKTPDWEV